MKHKKFKKVTFDNKKRSFHLEYTSGLKIDCPYSALGIREKVTDAAPDAEVGDHSFYFVLESGKKDYVPYDQPLHIAQVPKRELARRLNTSMSQLSRLLDTTNYKKELSRLIQIAAMLNYEFKWQFKKAV